MASCFISCHADPPFDKEKYVSYKDCSMWVRFPAIS